MSKEIVTRRNFLKNVGISAGAFGLLTTTGRAVKTIQNLDKSKTKEKGEKVIQGFDDTKTDIDTSKKWKQKFDRKIKVGIVGYGLCKFGAAFGFQDHPNVEVVAVSDLFPDRCAGLAKACRCSKTYPSLEELVKDDEIEAVFVATDAPHHAQHVIEVLNHGKHAACAVPATFSLEEADKLYKTVKKTGLNYMMFETSAFHDDVYAMRTLYNAGILGDIIYSEGEYYHYVDGYLPSYKEWRKGLPPMMYPTHATAYYVAVGGGSFTDVACLGKSSVLDVMKPENNIYKNPFGSEVALLKTDNGGMSRMAISWDTPGHHAEAGLIRCSKGTYKGTFQGLSKDLPELRKPLLPPNLAPGGHGGSHGYLSNEFIMSILENRKPLVNIAWSLNMTVPGIVAHQSALKNGEWLKIPQYKF
ncbi:Gfo/Idh/MocA family oxidoreductase [bacterium]|nr:Gfo/Idh/MocA family oxidoreductase [bacterium]